MSTGTEKDKASVTAKPHQTFVIRLRTRPGVDGIRALKALLKIAGRRLGLHVLAAHEETGDGGAFRESVTP